jgi:hypothetical protein
MKVWPIILILLGVCVLSLVVIDLYWWIDISSDYSKSFDQVKAEYNSKFPGFLRGGYRIAVFNIFLLVISSLCFLKNLKSGDLKILSLALLSICGLLGAWMLFSLM